MPLGDYDRGNRGQGDQAAAGGAPFRAARSRGRDRSSREHRQPLGDRTKRDFIGAVGGGGELSRNRGERAGFGGFGAGSGFRGSGSLWSGPGPGGRSCDGRDRAAVGRGARPGHEEVERCRERGSDAEAVGASIDGGAGVGGCGVQSAKPVRVVRAAYCIERPDRGLASGISGGSLGCGHRLCHEDRQALPSRRLPLTQQIGHPHDARPGEAARPDAVFYLQSVRHSDGNDEMPLLRR